MRAAKFMHIAVNSPVCHRITHGTARCSVRGHASRRFLLPPKIKGNDGLCLDVAGGLINFHLVVARIEYEKSCARPGRCFLDQARRHFSIIDMRRRYFQGDRQFTFRIDRQMNFVTKPCDFIAEGINFCAPVRITRLLAFAFGLLFLVSAESGAVYGDVTAFYDTFLLTACDQILKKPFCQVLSRQF
ncbi:hypothetical protein CM49_06688 [Paenibacillus sp. P1XP2]|nr:hypothetical protein CM49_06688 [Paenibacillus sp. P1XP2]